MKTRKITLILPILFICILTALSYSCKKENIAPARGDNKTINGRDLVKSIAKDSVKSSVKSDPVIEIVYNPEKTYGTITDVDGNTYKTISIGTQTWMAENLSTTHLNNGDPIPNVINNFDWENLLTPGYCWYNNDAVLNKSTYGALYNWYTVETDKLCPMGWHVPSNDEWNTLITYLGGEVSSGAKVLETGNTHWLRTLSGVTNETGFTALPGGFRSISNNFRGFYSIGYFGMWWTTTEYTPPSDALIVQAPSFDDSSIEVHWGIEASFAAKKYGGASVRCVKN